MSTAAKQRSLLPLIATASLLAIAMFVALPALASDPSVGDTLGSDSVESAATPQWAIPSGEKVRPELVKWYEGIAKHDSKKPKFDTLWPDREKSLRGTVLLERLTAVVAAADPNGAELVQTCQQPFDFRRTTSLDWLQNDSYPPLVRNNLRLYYGRYLAQQRQFDKCQETLTGLKPADVVDPASLLFYQAVLHHWFLQKEPGQKTIATLLQRRKEIPRRYAQLADMMLVDLRGLEDESLDHISRRMNDVSRRLDLGQAGKKVRGVEDGIVKSLDKIINKIEQQQQQSGGGSGSGEGQQMQGQQQGGGGQLGAGTKRKPASAKGKTDHDNWSELPPKQRQEAMQQIGKEFPSHYRDIIEQYFRKLATEDSPNP